MIVKDVVLTRVQLITAALVLLIAGGLVSDLESVIASPNAAPGGSVLRVGTVLATPQATATFVWVRMEDDGEPVPLRYQAPYVPVPGDLVNVLFSSPAGGAMNGTVLGGRAGQSGNLVPNPDFRAVNHLRPAADAEPPYMWYAYNASGPAAVCSAVLNTLRQRQMCMLDSNNLGSSDNYLYSSAIEVQRGQELEIDAMYDAFILGTTTLQVETRVAFYTLVEASYPEFVSEVVIAVDTFSGTGNFWQSGSTFVPTNPGIAYARVSTRANYTNGGGGSRYELFVGLISARAA